jgi:hypothetical protein
MNRGARAGGFAIDVPILFNAALKISWADYTNDGAPDES